MRLTGRRKFLIGGGAAVAGAGAVGALSTFLKESSSMPATDKMPLVFVGHGTPRSAVETNMWTASWEALGARLPRPAAILAISAHWLTRGGSLVTASRNPRMNYDFHGFPQNMYEVVYPAPGNVDLAENVQTLLGARLPVRGDTDWGFDHGRWVVLKYMFPGADIPVIQLSIDFSRPPSFHYELGRLLQGLRRRGVLIFGSGNIVHNLGIRPGMNGDRPYDWAVEFDAVMWKHIQEGNHQGVMDFQKLASAAPAHPTYDHFLPLLYCLGATEAGDAITAFNDNFQWPAVSMRSILAA